MPTFEIYWSDLTEEAKERLADMYHGNIEMSPIAIIDIEDEGVHVQIITEWSDGTVIATPGKLYKDGTVESLMISDIDPDGFLNNEYVIVNETGQQHPICMGCHERILEDGQCPNECDQ